VSADSVLYSDYQSLAEVQKAAEAAEAETISAAESMQVMHRPSLCNKLLKDISRS
jgi:hypothetical protein